MSESSKPLNDHPLAELQREVQQLKGQQLELSARIGALEARLITWSEISEEGQQPLHRHGS